MTAEDYRHDGGGQNGSTGRMDDDERRMGAQNKHAVTASMDAVTACRLYGRGGLLFVHVVVGIVVERLGDHLVARLSVGVAVAVFGHDGDNRFGVLGLVEVPVVHLQVTVALAEEIVGI